MMSNTGMLGTPICTCKASPDRDPQVMELVTMREKYRGVPISIHRCPLCAKLVGVFFAESIVTAQEFPRCAKCKNAMGMDGGCVPEKCWAKPRGLV